MPTRLRLLVLLLAIPTLLPAPARAESACREQKPQGFLVRSEMRKNPLGFPAAIRAAIEYRVGQYGFVPNVTPHFGAAVSAPDQTEETRFMGLPVRVHRRILPALQCVEKAIQETCTAPGATYSPDRLSGLRTRNTYQGGEVSNHMFGIAVDVDPDRNPCCGCVAPWSDDPKCKKPSTTPFDRTELPRCWVAAFERFGFYWLGWDEMQDTMHFEFLGDPAKILN